MKTHIRNFLIGFAFLAAGLATAATFNLFQPASGILVGNPSTYITTAATSANIVATFSGTCNSGTVLKGDGSCAAVVTSPAGSDTQVQFNDAGAFGADAGLVYNKTTDLLTAGSLNAASLTAPAGLNLLATGANQLGFFTNGIARFAIGSGGDWAVSGGVGTNGQVLTSGGAGVMPTWTTVSGGGSGANPTALVGLTAVNGASGNFIRADGAPALDQGIVPTWTGIHTYALAFPKLDFRATGAGVDAKNTLLQFFNTSFSISSASDAAPTSTVTDAFATTRAGSAWTSVNFGNTTDNPTYKFFGTGTTTFSGRATIANTAPVFYFDQTGAASNERLWREVATGGALIFDTRTDADGAGTQWLQVDRTGTTVDGILFNNPSSGEIKLTGTNTGVTNQAFLSFRDSAATRKGFVGDGGGSDESIYLAADAAGANIILTPGSGGSITSGGVNMTPGTTTSTGTVTGCTTAPTVTVRFVKIGNQATLYIDNGTICTSNSVNFTLTGAVPAGYQPARSVFCPQWVTNNNTLTAGSIELAASSAIITAHTGISAAFTASGQKEIIGQQPCTYPLN
jgi:hypothetical protein